MPLTLITHYISDAIKSGRLDIWLGAIYIACDVIGRAFKSISLGAQFMIEVVIPYLPQEAPPASAGAVIGVVQL
jgi:hypothetical protein